MLEDSPLADLAFDQRSQMVVGRLGVESVGTLVAQVANPGSELPPSRSNRAKASSV